MLTTRIISALLGFLILLFFIFIGSLPFTAFIIVVLIVSLNEYNRITPTENRINNLIFTSVFSIMIILFTYLTNTGLLNWPVTITFFILIILLIITHLFFSSINDFSQRLSHNLLGIIYIAGGLSFIILLRDYSQPPFNGTRALWLVLIATWATDTGGYFIGINFGKNKLIERISPKKTIEGALGGIMFTIILISLYTFWLEIFNNYWLLYSVLVSLLAVVGDLFESGLKRASGVKDSGTIIPGHGGILDRIDSLLFTAPFTYFFIQLLINNYSP